MAAIFCAPPCVLERRNLPSRANHRLVDDLTFGIEDGDRDFLFADNFMGKGECTEKRPEFMHPVFSFDIQRKSILGIAAKLKSHAPDFEMGEGRMKSGALPNDASERGPARIQSGCRCLRTCRRNRRAAAFNFDRCAEPFSHVRGTAIRKLLCLDRFTVSA